MTNNAATKLADGASEVVEKNLPQKNAMFACLTPRPRATTVTKIITTDTRHMQASSRFFNNPMTLLTLLPSFLSHQRFKFDGIDSLTIAFAPFMRKLPTFGADP